MEIKQSIYKFSLIFFLGFNSLNAQQTDETPKTESSDKVATEETLYDLKYVETKPEFPGGIGKFYEHIGKNFVTPKRCKGGKLIIYFVIDKDGSLTDFKILQDIGRGAGEEAIRVLKLCPAWIPGTQNGEPVRVQYTLPISIQAK